MTETQDTKPLLPNGPGVDPGEAKDKMKRTGQTGGANALASEEKDEDRKPDRNPGRGP